MSSSSSAKHLDNNSNNNNNSLDYDERLCHVIKRSDFDGYGFNLHAEKGRPGQYIGKVDPNSPAELAGLREGDRIIEVNGVNIKMESHKQVVERIKMLSNETKLLVIDPRAKINDQNEIVKKEMVNNNDKINNNNNDENKTSSNVSAKSTPPATPPVTNSNNNNNNKNNNNIPKESPPVTPIAVIEPKPLAVAKPVTPPVVPVVVTPPVAPVTVPKAAVPESAEQKSPTPQPQTPAPAPAQQQSKNPLKLPMTVAEMRAQLAAKKKYDPKNDTSELRKKYDMLQKL